MIKISNLSKTHHHLLTLFFQSSIITLIEFFNKGNNYVYKIKTDLYRSAS